MPKVSFDSVLPKQQFNVRHERKRKVWNDSQISGLRNKKNDAAALTMTRNAKGKQGSRVITFKNKYFND